MSRIIGSGQEGYADLIALQGRVRPYDGVWWQLVRTATDPYFVEILKATEKSSFGSPMAGFYGCYTPDESVLPDPHELDEWQY